MYKNIFLKKLNDKGYKQLNWQWAMPIKAHFKFQPKYLPQSLIPYPSITLSQVTAISSNTMASLSLNAPLLRFSLHRPIHLPSRLFSPVTFSNPLHSSPRRCISTYDTSIATSLPDNDTTTAKLPELEGSELEDKEREEEKVVLPRFPVPILTVKEKKELASYAHSLGKKLKYQQVGKSGVTPAVAASFVQTLEANELLKVPFFSLSLSSSIA